MKHLFILSLVFFGACSTAVTESIATVEGVWVLEDTDLQANPPILKKHVLTLAQNSFEEAFFENNVPKGQEEGTFLMSRDGMDIEFSLTGNIQRVFKGTISGNQMLIHTINSQKLNPPALYRRK